MTIALLLFAITLVLVESKNKKIDTEFAVIIIKWVMVLIIVTCIRDILDQLIDIMWWATIGIGASFGLDLTRKGLQKKYDEIDDEIRTAQKNINVARATEEIIEEEREKKTQTFKIKIKK